MIKLLNESEMFVIGLCRQLRVQHDHVVALLDDLSADWTLGECEDELIAAKFEALKLLVEAAEAAAHQLTGPHYDTGYGAELHKARGDSVDHDIAQMRTELRAVSDSALAEMLGVGRSAISQWRKRGAIPAPARAKADQLAEACRSGRASSTND